MANSPLPLRLASPLRPLLCHAEPAGAGCTTPSLHLHLCHATPLPESQSKEQSAAEAADRQTDRQTDSQERQSQQCISGRSGSCSNSTRQKQRQQAAMRILCDVCEAAPAKVFCAADEAALCLACDNKVHGCNKLASRHVRLELAEARAIPRCDICENAPAFFYCAVDGTSLCLQCDLDVHIGGKKAHERYLLMGQRVEVRGGVVWGRDGGGKGCGKKAHERHLLMGQRMKLPKTPPALAEDPTQPALPSLPPLSTFPLPFSPTPPPPHSPHTFSFPPPTAPQDTPRPVSPLTPIQSLLFSIPSPSSSHPYPSSPVPPPFPLPHLSQLPKTPPALAEDPTQPALPSPGGGPPDHPLRPGAQGGGGGGKPTGNPTGNHMGKTGNADMGGGNMGKGNVRNHVHGSGGGQGNAQGGGGMWHGGANGGGGGEGEGGRGIENGDGFDAAAGKDARRGHGGEGH
ncbi:unnamed protein product [Closterium sp. NIES-54]